MMGDFPRVAAVLFDAVDTLIYPNPPVAQVYCHLGRRFGSQLDVAEIKHRFRDAFNTHARAASLADRRTTHADERTMWRHIVADVFCDVSNARDELFEALWRYFAQPESWRVYDDVGPCWAELADRGLQIAIASNFDDRLLGICRGLPWLSECRHVFWSARLGHCKPRLEFFDEVRCRIDLPAERLLMVGDDWRNDYDGAIAAGWQAALVDRQQVAGDDGQSALPSLLELPSRLP